MSLAHAESAVVDLHDAVADSPRAENALGLIVARVRLALQDGPDTARAAIDARLAGPVGAPRTRIAEVFALSPGEIDLLDLTVALAVEPALAADYAAAQGAPHRVCPTEMLARALFGREDGPVWRAGSSLAIWGLIAPVARSAGEPESFEADPRVVDWLHGVLGLDTPLIGYARLVEPQPPFSAWPVLETARNASSAMERSGGARVIVSGLSGSGRASFAASIAGMLHRRALSVDLSKVGEDYSDVLIRTRRLAHMADLAVVWRDPDRPIIAGHPPPAPLEFVVTSPRSRIAPVEGAVDLFVTLPPPNREERCELWRRLLPEAAAWPATALDGLAARPGVAVGDIVAVARGAPTGAAQAAERLRARARMRLGEAGRVLAPRLRWDDLVLPAPTLAALEEIAFEAAARIRLLAEPEPNRLYARSGGLAVLFSGPPGTGKTMAAEVIANALGADLLAVDLATTVSKYIGETAKNLSRAFDEAAAAGAILLFDEADALFARRTEIKDSHDRYANADTNHLLQLLEEFDGLAILATNRRSNMDPAFVRRIRHVVEFTRPSAAERRAIWYRAIAALAGEAHTAFLTPGLDGLADRHEVTAAQIKNAALSARYAAMRRGGVITQAQIQLGLARELAKEGRSIDGTASQRRSRHG
jgi:hypothetical protein